MKSEYRTILSIVKDLYESKSYKTFAGLSFTDYNFDYIYDYIHTALQFLGNSNTAAYSVNFKLTNKFNDEVYMELSLINGYILVNIQ